MKRTSLFLPEPMLAALAELARKKDLSMAELVRMAVEKMLREQRDGTD